jgi:hypothetical protein
MLCKGRTVKCTLVQALRLCTGRTAYKGSRGIALPFHNHGTRRGEGSASRPGPFFTPGKDLVPTVQEAGWAPAGVHRQGGKETKHTASHVRWPLAGSTVHATNHHLTASDNYQQRQKVRNIVGPRVPLRDCRAPVIYTGSPHPLVATARGYETGNR